MRDCDKANNIVMICEVMKEVSYVKYHNKKFVYIFSAMCQFILELHKARHRESVIQTLFIQKYR
ncbi:MAG: cryptochrome/photolyase family protein [Francisella endosymbiont of Hyalomma scupense]